MGRSFFSFAQAGDGADVSFREALQAQLAEEQPAAFVLSANEASLDAFIISSSPEDVFALWGRLEGRMERLHAVEGRDGSLDALREAADAAVLKLHAALARVASGTRPDISEETRELSRHLTSPRSKTVAQILADVEAWKGNPGAERADAQVLRDELALALGVRVTLQRLSAVRGALARFRADPEGAVAQLRRDAARCLEIRYSLETVTDLDEKAHLEGELASLPMMHVLSDAEIQGLSRGGQSVAADAGLADNKLGMMLDGLNTSLRSALRGTTDFTKDRTVAAGLQQLLRLDAAGYAMAFARVHVDDEDEGTRRFSEAVVQGDAIDEETPKLAVAVAAAGLAGAAEILAGLGVAADAIAMAMLAGKLPLDAYALYASGEAVGEAEWQWGEHQAVLSESDGPIDGWNGQWNRIGAWSGLAFTAASVLGTDALLLGAGLSPRPVIETAIDDVPQANVSRGNGENPTGSAGGSRVEGRRGSDVAAATLREPDRRTQPVFVVEAKKVPGERVLPVRETRTAVEPLATDRPQPPARMPSRDPDDVVGAFRSGGSSEADAIAARAQARAEVAASRAAVRLGGAAEAGQEETIVVGAGASRMDPVPVTQDQFMALKAANAGQRGPKVRVIFRVASTRPVMMPQEGRGLVLQQMELLEEVQELDVALASLARLGIRVATRGLPPPSAATAVEGMLIAPNGIAVSPELLSEAQVLSPAPEAVVSSAALAGQMERAERAAASAAHAAGLEGRPLVGPWSILRPETRVLLEGAWPVLSMLAGMRPGVGSSSQTPPQELVLEDDWSGGVLPLSADSDVEEVFPMRAGGAEESAAANTVSGETEGRGTQQVPVERNKEKGAGKGPNIQAIVGMAEGKVKEAGRLTQAVAALAQAARALGQPAFVAIAEELEAPLQTLAERTAAFKARVGVAGSSPASEELEALQQEGQALSRDAAAISGRVGQATNELYVISGRFAPEDQARVADLVSRGIMTEAEAAEVERFMAYRYLRPKISAQLSAIQGNSAKDPAGALGQLRGLLFELRRLRQFADERGGLPSDIGAAKSVKVSFDGVDEAGNPKRIEKSPIDVDVPVDPEVIHEVKAFARMEAGETAASLNQPLRYQQAIADGHFRSALIELSGNVAPRYLELAAARAPDVEVRYVLELPDGGELAATVKAARERAPVLSARRADGLPLSERAARVVRGYEAARERGALAPLMARQVLDAADCEGSAFAEQLVGRDPREIKDLALIREYMRLAAEKRWRMLEAMVGEATRPSPSPTLLETTSAPRFPQFDRRIADILGRVTPERRADAQLAIDALLASVPAGSSDAVVGKMVGQGLKAIEAKYSGAMQSARLTKAEAEAQKAREARERLVARGVVTPEMAAAIDAYAARGEAAAARVREAFLAAGGHSNATADIQAYNGLQGLLYEARRSAEVQGSGTVGTGGSLPRRSVRVRYNGVRFTPEGWRLQEKVSEVDLDVPEAAGRIYEVKWSPRINYGENIDGTLNEGALNQAIKMNAAVEQGLFSGATIEVAGNVSPEFFALLGQWAPRVEVLYTLKLSGGQEVAFRMKRGPDGTPTLRRMPDIRALGERDQTIMDGLRRVLQSGRIFRDGIFRNDFLTLADIPEMVPSYQEFRTVAGEDGRIDPRRIIDLKLYLEWERRIQAKRLRVLEEKPTSTPLRRRTEHLTRPATEESIDEHLAEIERSIASAPPHTVKQYSLRRGTPEWAAVRAEFGSRLRAIAAYERERLGSAEEAGRQARRAAMGYRGPREGYPLDPLHIYMDVVKGAREAARGKGGGGARSYGVDWPTADAVFAEIAAGRYARQERLIRIVSPTPYEPDVNEQLTNVREYRARDASERRKVLDLLHERNRLRLRGKRDALRPLLTRRARAGIEAAEGALASLIAERNERIHAIDASGTPPRERGPQMRAVAEASKGRIREAEEGILGLYEQALGTSRYRQHFEYVERDEESDVVKFIYTVDADGVMRLVHEDLHPGAERPAHSELAKGRNIYGAGQIWVHGTPAVGPDGSRRVVVKGIDDGSGHYRPDTIEMLPYVREVLRGYGFEVEAARAEHAPLPVVPLDERFDEPVNPWGESPTRVR